MEEYREDRDPEDRSIHVRRLMDDYAVGMRALIGDPLTPPGVRRAAIAQMLDTQRQVSALLPAAIRALVALAYLGLNLNRNVPELAEVREGVRGNLIDMGLLTEDELARLSEGAALEAALARYRIWDETGEVPG